MAEVLDDDRRDPPPRDPRNLPDRRSLLAGAAAALAGAGIAALPSPAPAIEPAVRTAVAPLPLPAGAKIAFLGDSYVQRGAYSRRDHGELKGYTALARGTMNLLAGLDPRFRIEIFATADHPFEGPDGDNELTGSMHGLGGDRLSFERKGRPGYLGRLQYCLDRRPDVVVVESAGINDVSDGDPADVIVANLEAILTVIRAHRRHAVVLTLPILEKWDEPRRDVARAVNGWLAERAADGRDGFHLADTRALEGEPGSRSGHFTDGVHRSPAGTHAVVTSVLLPLLRGLVAGGSAYATDPLDANLFPRAGLPGRSGTSSVDDGAPGDIEGEVADGMHVARRSGRSRVVCSKEPAPAGAERQVFEIRAVDDGLELHEFVFVLDTPGGTMLADLGVDLRSDWGMEFQLPVELDDWDGWLMPARAGGGPVSLFVELYGSDPTTFRRQANSSATFKGGAYTLRTLAQFGPDDTRPDHLRWGRPHRAVRILFDPSVGGTGTVKIGSPVWRRLAESPARDWHL